MKKLKTKDNQFLEAFKQKKGITLVALVITIIVLLILSVVVVSVVTQSGIFTKANEAQLESIKAQVDEKIKLAVTHVQMEITQKELQNPNYKATEDLDNIIGILQKELPVSEGYVVSLEETKVATLDVHSIKIGSTDSKIILITYTNVELELTEEEAISYELEIKANNSLTIKKAGELIPMTEEEKKAWDAEATSEDMFIWASNDPTKGELYGTIIGYTNDLIKRNSIKIPSRCVVIDLTYTQRFGGDSSSSYYVSGSGLYSSSYITSVELPKTVTKIEGAFFGFSKLTSITLPDSINYIGGNSFLGCNSLNQITFPKNIEFIKGGTLDNTSWYNNQPQGPIYIGKVLYKYKGAVPNNTTFEVKDGTVTIAAKAFENTVVGDSSSSQKAMDGLVGVKVPSSLCFIDRAAFYQCYNLATFEAKEDATLDNITYVGAFNFTYSTQGACAGGTASSAWFANQPDGPVYIGKVLYKYKYHYEWPGYKEITIKDGTRTISEYAFYNLPNNGSDPSFQHIEKVNIPNSVEIIDDYAFYNCTRLKDVNMPDNIIHIGAYAFANCSSIESITFSRNAFQECANDIHDSDIVAGSIGLNAFYRCTALKSVDILGNKPYIFGSTTNSTYAFLGCTNLTNPPKND